MRIDLPDEDPVCCHSYLEHDSASAKLLCLPAKYFAHSCTLCCVVSINIYLAIVSSDLIGPPIPLIIATVVALSERI